MDYSKLVAVTGLPGLFLLAGNKADGIIVKNLEDGSIKFISSRKEKFTQLEIFLAMKQSGEPLPSEKDPKALKTYFEKVYPDLDFDRVYGSDMKKMVRWFAVIKQHGITIKVAEETPEEEETTDTPAE